MTDQTIRPAYSKWPDYNRALREVLARLTPSTRVPYGPFGPTWWFRLLNPSWGVRVVPVAAD